MKKYRNSFRKREMKYCMLFVSPWIVGALLLFLYPLYYSLRLSFGLITDQVTQSISFVGLDNFKVAFLEDAKFFPLMLSIAKDTLINTPLIVVFSLFIAMMLNKNILAKGMFRTIFFLPVILGTGFVMQQLLGMNINADSMEIARGIFLPDKLIRSLNPVLTEMIMDFLNRITIILWKSGVQIILFLAALQSIPKSYYEASRVDAATEWECFWFITLPMLVPIILLNSVFTVVSSFLDTSNEMLAYIKELSFQWSQNEYAAAVSWLYFLFVMIVLAIIFILLGPASKRLREN